jgi:hypothetical protein
MNRGNRKCPKCGLVTWADYEDCPTCGSGGPKRSGLKSRIRFSVILCLGCAAIFGVYRYVNRPLPPNSEELRQVFQSIAQSRFTSTASIDRGTGEFYDAVNIQPGWYELRNTEIKAEDGFYYYSADFSLQTNLTDGRSGPGYDGRVKLKRIGEKWEVASVNVNEPR